MTDKPTRGNGSKGMTKEVLTDRLQKVTRDYTTKFGNRKWVIEALEQEAQRIRDMPY